MVKRHHFLTYQSHTTLPSYPHFVLVYHFHSSSCHCKSSVYNLAFVLPYDINHYYYYHHGVIKHVYKKNTETLHTKVVAAAASINTFLPAAIRHRHFPALACCRLVSQRVCTEVAYLQFLIVLCKVLV